jgi:hypothetical protein
VWHNVLYQAMENLTVLAIAQSVYNVVALLLIDDDPMYEVAVTYLTRWADSFDSLTDIEDNVY